AHAGVSGERRLAPHNRVKPGGSVDSGARAQAYGGTPPDGKSATLRLCPTVASASAADNSEKVKMPGVAVRSTRPKRRVVVVTPSVAVTRIAATKPPA